MQAHRQEGFSIALKIVVLFIITAILAAGWLLVLYSINNQAESKAESVASSFVVAINKNNAQDGYSILSSDSQKSNNSFFNLYLWISEFHRNDITVDLTPSSVQTGLPQINMFKFLDKSTIVFKTNNSSSVKLSLILINNKWFVQDYTAI